VGSQVATYSEMGTARLAPIVTGRSQRACSPRRPSAAGTPRCLQLSLQLARDGRRRLAERLGDRPKLQTVGRQTGEPITLLVREVGIP
jgi:hypothetical protein